eukprot:scaffold43813_cov18-Tisochrysis_lutea.AAC.3
MMMMMMMIVYVCMCMRVCVCEGGDAAEPSAFPCPDLKAKLRWYKAATAGMCCVRPLAALWHRRVAVCLGTCGTTGTCCVPARPVAKGETTSGNVAPQGCCVPGSLWYYRDVTCAWPK